MKNKNTKARPYKTLAGEVFPILPLTGNTPRISAFRTGNDRKYLQSNNGKLSKLQHIFG